MRRRTRVMVAAAILVGFFVTFVSAVTVYINRFDKELAQQNRNHLSEVSMYISAHMTSVVSDTQEALKAVSSAVSYAFSGITTEEERLGYLADVSEQYRFAYIGYAGLDGMLHATEPSQSVDVSGEDYFKAALRGESAVSNLTRAIFKDRAASGILLSVPIGKERPMGMLVAMVEVSTLGDALSLESFDGEGYSYIFDKKGAIIMRTKSLDFNNLFNAWKNVEFEKGYGYDQFYSDVMADREGLTCFNNLGVKQYAYYYPMLFNDWSVVNIVAEKAVSGQTDQLIRELVLLGGAMIAVFLALMFFAMRSYGASQDSKQATDAKSAFLANMSHEIRTPMNAIVGISEILLRDNLSPTQRSKVLNILNSGKGLLTIINDILDLSKIESGKFTIIDETYELESMLYDLTVIAAIRIGEKPVEFLVELVSDLPRCLVGDMGRVKQVLLNIVGNAIKFTDRGCIRLLIGGKKEDGGWRLQIEVRDTGIGIREEDLSKLFVSFNQVDTQRNRNIEGTGLGLTISRRLCEMMNGKISVTSEYGKGSSFVITIRQGIAATEELVAGGVDKTASLLLCEPSEVLRAYETACLERFGLRYDFCEGEEAFAEKLAAGGYTHALAGRDLFGRLHDGKPLAGVSKITLLGLNEHALIDSGTTNIYVPLFPIQLPYALSGITDHTHAQKKAGIGLDVIEPMPYVSILVVDDNLVNIEVAKGLMDPYNMRISHACSGAEAVQAVQDKPFDLILMDHMMPGMSGIEAARLIRALPDESCRKIPIVALTANATSDARQMFLEEGFDGFLSKPIETQKLNRVLRQYLKPLNDARAAERPPAPERLDAPPPKAEPLSLSEAPSSGEVNFREGLDSMGSADIYAKILRTYLKSTVEKLPRLTGWMEGDPARFVVEIHGLKSASASVGAAGLAGLAAELEQQGKDNRFDAISAGLPAFLERGKRALAEIEAYLTQTNGGESSPAPSDVPPASIPLTTEMLDELEAAFRQYDNGRIKALLDGWQWLTVDGEPRHLLEKLRACFDAYEYEQPLALLQEYREQAGVRPKSDTAEEERKHIVVVDDTPVNLDLAENVLSADYRLTKLISGKQLLHFLETVVPDMILLDILMPEMDGFETLQAIREREEWRNIPVIFLTGQNDILSEREGFRLGAKDFIRKPFDNVVMLSRVRSQMELYQYQTELKEIIGDKTQEVEALQHVITISWAEIIESRDGTTGSHVRHTTCYYEALLGLLCEMPAYREILSGEDTPDLLRASALHDIGKIGISDLVLKKPGPLTPEEFGDMKHHSRIGADMIQKIINGTRPDRFLLYARDMALYHHERWDGTGYPCGLKGDEIPFYVQVLTMADIFDALTAVRPYKRAFTFEEAIEIMCKDRGRFYCPELFDVFLEHKDVVKFVLDHKTET